MKDLLLHVCCGPCASGCVPLLIESGRKVTLFYSNSNIGTEEEYLKRLEFVKLLAEEYSLPLVVDPYDHASWLKSVSASCPSFASEPEHGRRCRECFRFSLTRTATEAKKRNFAYATTLTVSPYKDAEVIFSVMGDDGDFEHINFRKEGGWELSRENSRRLNMYRQKFCGCEFSFLERENFLKTKEMKKLQNNSEKKSR